MGLIEIEIDRMNFQYLVTFLVRKSAIPDPTFEVLGDDRLIRSFDCANVSLGDIAPGLEPPPGIIAAKVDVSIGHASVAELEADPTAKTVTQATGWVYVSLVPIPGKLNFVVTKGKSLLIADLIRIDVPGRPITERFDSPNSRRWGRQPLGSLPIPLPAIVHSSPVTGSAVMLSEKAATIRVATAWQNIFDAPADRLVALESLWDLRVSPEVFTELLMDALQKSVTPAPPGGAELIEAPSVNWAQTSVARGPGGAVGLGDVFGWGAVGSYRLKKHKACGDADVSVTVHTTLLPVPDYSNQTLTIYLEISADADDGTTFTCWLENLGVWTGLAGFFTEGVFAIGVGLVGFAVVGDQVEEGVGQGVQGHAPEQGFTSLGGGTNFSDYSMTVNLDLGALSEVGATMEYGQSSADGVVFAGNLEILKAIFIEHKPTYDPAAGSTLSGTWASGYKCDTGWHASFELPRIHITDPIVDPSKGTKLFDQEVALFDTSWVVPPTHWKIDSGPTVIDKFVSIVGDLWAYTGPTPVGHGPHRPPRAGHVFLHTSAGIARFEIARVPPPPGQPSEAELVINRGNCSQLVARFHDIRWLVDPPEFDYGHDPLRNWIVTLPEVPLGTQIGVVGVQDGIPTQRLAYMMMEQNKSVTIEMVTDRETELRIEHNLDAPLERAKINQQWLLPTTTAALSGEAVGLERKGDRVEATPAGTVLSVSTGSVLGQDESTMPPPSLALPDGRIAAVHGSRLVLAYPFGGIAVRAPIPDH